MNWFKQIYKSVWSRPVSRVKSLMGAVRAALGGAFAGAWVTDHREEANHFTGFNYVAIHAIASQVAGATVTAFSDGSQQFGRQMKRKALRKAHGTFARYKSTYGLDDIETDPLPPTHPLVKILKKPNPYENGATFRYRQAQQLRLTGTCYIWNVPSVAGQTCQRFVIPTAMATPTQPTRDLPMGGLRVQPNASRYIPLEDNGFIEGSPTWAAVLNQTVDMRQIQKISYPHPFWMDDGQSPISAGAKWVDGAEAVDSARTAQLRNGIDPSIAVELPDDVDFTQDEMDRYTQKVADKYGGPDNVGRVMVNLAGTTVTPLSTSPKDMGYGEGFEDFKSACLALHQTPPVAVGIQDPGAYAAYYASMKAWRHAAVQPLCDMLAESDTEHLAPQFGEGLTVEIESNEIDDSDQLENMLRNDLAAGIRTLNEWRTLRGLPPDETPAGDEYVKPSAQKSGDKTAADGTDGGSSSPPAYPKTPLGQSKALRTAIRAAEDGDFEWLTDKLVDKLRVKPRRMNRKAFNPSEPRDSNGKWTAGASESGYHESHDEAQAVADRVNELHQQHRIKPVEVDHDDDGWHVVHGGDLFDSSAEDDLRENHNKVQQANAILEKHGLKPAAKITHGFGGYDSSHDVDELEEASSKVDKANEELRKHGLKPNATIARDGTSFDSTVDPDEVSQAGEEVERANKILEQYGTTRAKVVKGQFGYQSSIDPDEVEFTHYDVSEVNKRLESLGMDPKVKVVAKGGSVDASHDINDINNALDTITEFKKKKALPVGDVKYEAALNVLADFMTQSKSIGMSTGSGSDGGVTCDPCPSCGSKNTCAANPYTVCGDCQCRFSGAEKMLEVEAE